MGRDLDWCELLLGILFEVGVNELIYKVPYCVSQFTHILNAYGANRISIPCRGRRDDRWISKEPDIMFESNVDTEGVICSRLNLLGTHIDVERLRD